MQRLLPFLFLALACLAAEPSDTVLVLPFFNESGPANLDWLGISIAQTVRESIAARGILVLEREERQEAYRRLSIRPNAHLTHASVIKVAEALDANQVIYGQFEFRPPAPGEPAARGMLNITAYTLDMRRMRKGPELIESGPLEGLAALQAHLAWQALMCLAPETTPPAETFLKELPSVRLNAIENYTRGVLASNPEQKRRFFMEAARLDERFSSPNFELGRLDMDRKEYRLAAGWFAKVNSTASRYLEANFLMGLCLYHTGDYKGARRAFELVTASVPLNEVFNNLGAAESNMNDPAALESFRKALEGDPGDPDYHFNVGYELWRRGQFDKAAESFRAVLDRNPEDAQATVMLGRCLRQTGPRSGDGTPAQSERIKVEYQEGAWRQLKAALESTKPKREPPATR